MQNQPHVIAYFHSSLLGFSLHNVHMGFYAFIQCPPQNISGLPKQKKRPAIRVVKFKILWNIRIQRGRRGARRVFRIMGFLHTGNPWHARGFLRFTRIAARLYVRSNSQGQSIRILWAEHSTLQPEGGLGSMQSVLDGQSAARTT